MWSSEYLEACFAKLMKGYNSARMLHLVASQAPQGTMAPYLSAEIQKIIKGLYEVENSFIKLLDKATENKQVNMYLDLLRRLSKMQFVWYYNNSLNDNPKTIYTQIESLKQTLLSALELAKSVSKDAEFEIYLDLARLFGSIEDKKSSEEYLGKAMELAKELDHKGFIHAVETTTEQIEQSQSIPDLIKVKDAPSSGQIADEEEEKMTKKLLELAGININGSDYIAEIARLGLKDRNPERVLKHCQYLHTEIISWSPTWESFGLFSTGMKILFCEKKGIPIFDFELDVALEEIKTWFCSSCNSHCPRPTDWKWSHEWHRTRGQPLEMRKIMLTFPKR